MHWWHKAKLYELYIDRFAGTVEGTIEKLDYLERLGVNCLHILPHYPSPMVDDGYDITDYRGVRSELGTLDEFKELIEKAHARGIRILIDYPLNHTSHQHPWFSEARQSRNNEKRDWYLWSESGTEFKDAPNAFPHIKPSNWVRNDATNDFYYAMFYAEQPDLNWHNPEVRREMLDIMHFWAGLGVAGFRLDAVPHLIEEEGSHSIALPATHAAVKELRQGLAAKYPDAVMLAEARQEPGVASTFFGAGDECQLVYLFDLQGALMRYFATGDSAPIEAIIERTRDIPRECDWVTFLGNHDDLHLSDMDDNERHATLSALDPEGAYGFRFGETASLRVGTIFNGDEKKIVDAHRQLLSLPGVPSIYYGDEIGMRNTRLSEGERDTRRAVRGAFDWHEAERQQRDPESILSQISALLRKKILTAHR